MNRLETKKKLEREDILRLFTTGCKTEEDLCVGLEYERLPISVVTREAVPYGGDFGVCNFLRAFAKSENWDYITDDYNIIGLKQEHDTITLEPGSQVELSVKPEKTIFDIKKKIDSLNKFMAPILDKYNITS